MHMLQFERRYSAAHRLLSTASTRCRTPHGHTWYVRISVRADTPYVLDQRENMVCEFSKAKTRWHKFIDESVDHSLMLSEMDPLLDWFLANEPERASHLLLTPGDPTTEMLAALFQCKAQMIMQAEGTGLVVEEVRLKETPTNSVILRGAYAYEAHLPQGMPPAPKATDPAATEQRPPWWRLPDGSINNLSPGSRVL